MKTLTLLIALIVFCLKVTAQNVAFNQSFEDTSGAGLPSCWKGSYQYFNQTPLNGLGFQISSEGISHIGLAGYDTVTTVYEPHVKGILTQQILAGTQVCFSIDVSLCNESQYASGGWGIQFSLNPNLGSAWSQATVPDYYFSQIVTDTARWITLEGSFIIPITANYFTLYQYNPTGMLVNPGGGYGQGSIYYIDNIHVEMNTCTPLSIQPQSEPGGRTLLKESDLWGRNIDPTQFSGIRIRYYSDNSIEKVIVIDNGF